MSDFDCCVPVGPDCRDGKHRACDGRALNEHTDEVTACGCRCHSDRRVSVSTYTGQDGALVVQVDTIPTTGRVRINLNDAPVWDGDPERPQ